jgi:hypothetical protein
VGLFTVPDLLSDCCPASAIAVYITFQVQCLLLTTLYQLYRLCCNCSCLCLPVPDHIPPPAAADPPGAGDDWLH